MRHKEGDKAKDIMDSATALFAKRGFHSAGVSDIAAGARVSAGCIYLYFKDKSDAEPVDEVPLKRSECAPTTKMNKQFCFELDAKAIEKVCKSPTAHSFLHSVS